MSDIEPESAPPLRTSRLVTGFPIFFGWAVIAAGGLGRIMTSPGQTYAVSIFIEHLIDDLGLTRSLVSTLFTAGTLVGSLSLPYIGRSIDRRGPRIMVGVISLVLGLACIYMGFVQTAVMLFLGFVALRMLGQGAMGLVSRNVVNQWWVRRRGMAMGVSGLLASLLGQGGFPLLISGLIPGVGWRLTYVALGLMELLIMVPAGLVFFRERPEEYGLQPDGDADDPRAEQSTMTSAAEEDWTLQEAMRTPAFWIISAGLGAIALLGTGLTFHVVSIFEDSGLSVTVAAAAFVPIALTSAVVHFGSGVLADRVPVRLLLTVALFFLAGSLLMAPSLRNTTMAYTYGIFRGITGGLMLTVLGIVWAQYYGRRHLGAVSGVSFTLTTGASALGPMPLGIARDLLGSYHLTLTVAAAVPLVLGLVSLFARPPKRQALSLTRSDT